MEIPRSWEDCITQLISAIHKPQVVFVIGAPDVGKTTFCCMLANAAVEAGLLTMVIDSDVGQSDIGPPTTIGLGRVHRTIGDLSEAEYVAGFFVGHVSPAGHLLPMVVGTKLMVDKAIAHGAQFIIVDTTGLVKGLVGRELKLRKVQLIKPTSLVAIERGRELFHLLVVLERLRWLRIFRLDAPASAKQRDKETRKSHREHKFRLAFENAKEAEIPLSEVALLNTWLGSGMPVHQSFIAHLSELAETSVVHAERCDDIGLLLTEESIDETSRRWIASRWGVSEVITISLECMYGLVLGLHNANGELLCIALLVGFDSSSKSLKVLMPSHVSPKDVALVVFGRHRVNPDGTEIGSLSSQAL